MPPEEAFGDFPETTALHAAIRAIDYYLPARTLPNETLVRDFPRWTAETVESKTGIANRHIAAEDECASDLAVQAANRLFAQGVCGPSDIDYLLFCTQSPDYLLPTTACLLQQRLGLSNHIGALDFNLGCSGFVYGLSLAKGLVESGEAGNVLLLTSETYSKHMAPEDFSVRSIFGDGAAATLIQAQPCEDETTSSWIGPFIYGTDGKGKDALILRRGSLRTSTPGRTGQEPEDPKAESSLYMNGPEIFTFTLRVVPDSIARLLDKAGIELGQVDLFVFHQANRFILEHLRKKLHISEDKFVYALRDCGNTVSSTIPIGLFRAQAEGRLRPGHTVMLVGFGVGYSWGAVLVRWCATASSIRQFD